MCTRRKERRISKNSRTEVEIWKHCTASVYTECVLFVPRRVVVEHSSEPLSPILLLSEVHLHQSLQGEEQQTTLYRGKWKVSRLPARHTRHFFLHSYFSSCYIPSFLLLPALDFCFYIVLFFCFFCLFVCLFVCLFFVCLFVCFCLFSLYLFLLPALSTLPPSMYCLWHFINTKQWTSNWHHYLCQGEITWCR